MHEQKVLNMVPNHQHRQDKILIFNLDVLVGKTSFFFFHNEKHHKHINKRKFTLNDVNAII